MLSINTPSTVSVEDAKGDWPLFPSPSEHPDRARDINKTKIGPAARVDRLVNDGGMSVSVLQV